MSIQRACERCGKYISLRQMPGGQWVAFDYGTDKLHNCVLNANRTKKLSEDEILKLIRSAMQRQYALDITYYIEYRHSLNNRTIIPIRLYDHSQYLETYCMWRNDVRNFKLSRIRSIKLGRGPIGDDEWGRLTGIMRREKMGLYTAQPYSTNIPPKANSPHDWKQNESGWVWVIAAIIIALWVMSK